MINPLLQRSSVLDNDVQPPLGCDLVWLWIITSIIYEAMRTSSETSPAIERN